MCQRVVLSVLIFIGLTLNQTVNADISGKVSDQAGGAIEGATVTLESNGATATTGADGMYTVMLATTDVKTLSAPQLQNTGITLQKGFLNFSLPEAAPVKYEIFDVKGNLLKKMVLKNAQKGFYRFNITENICSTILLVIKASIGKKEMTFNYLPLNSKNAVYSQNLFFTPISIRLAEITAVADTIKVTADGYKEQAIAITSYDMEVNVTMEALDGDCGEFTLISDKLSSAIPTVGIIEWSCSKDVTSAHIEFGLQGSATVMEAPVDLSEPNYRTLLLGMKQKSSYVYRIVAETEAGTCVSDDYSLTTGSLSNAPSITQSGSGGSLMTGFIITTIGGGGGNGGGTSSSSMAIIFDMDGDVVWAASAPQGASRARMSWDGQDMWIMNLNNMGTTSSGEMRRVSMDGSDVEKNVSGLSGAHHDFTVTPENEIVTIAFNSSGRSQILVRSASGTVSALVADVSTLYQPASDCHPNYIQYYEYDSCFTLSDRNVNMFVKFRRDGTLLWQFGGSNPKGSSFSVGESWQVNHGHELEADGRFVFFNNGSSTGTGGGKGGMSGGASKVMEFKLDESTMTATKLWEYTTSGSSQSLGDIQRLPEDHYLVTVSNSGTMEELDGSQNVVKTFTASTFCYSEYRDKLYGPPEDY